MRQEKKQGDWADYLHGAIIAWPEIEAAIEGQLSIGGLSSSVAVIITFLSALCRLNSIQVKINMALSAENNYIDVASGKLDQSCGVYARKIICRIWILS